MANFTFGFTFEHEQPLLHIQVAAKAMPTRGVSWLLYSSLPDKIAWIGFALEQISTLELASL